MHDSSNRQDLKGPGTLETLAFRFLGEQTMVIIQHRRGETDLTGANDMYPVTVGDALGYPVYALGNLPDSSSFYGDIIGCLFDHGAEAGPTLIAVPAGQKLYRTDIRKALGLEDSPAGKHARLYCLYEKSTGAVPYALENGERKYLVIHSVQGHYCFPKGHLEAGENEEGGALREVWEETGLQVDLKPGFRHVTTYTIDPGYQKEVAYFIGQFARHPLRLQPDEVAGAELLSLRDALTRLTYENDRGLLRAADAWLNQKIYRAG